MANMKKALAYALMGFGGGLSGRDYIGTYLSRLDSEEESKKDMQRWLYTHGLEETPTNVGKWTPTTDLGPMVKNQLPPMVNIGGDYYKKTPEGIMADKKRQIDFLTAQSKFNEFQSFKTDMDEAMSRLNANPKNKKLKDEIYNALVGEYPTRSSDIKRALFPESSGFGFQLTQEDLSKMLDLGE